MATKTNNLGLSKAELTDAVRSTLTANNGNFDILDERCHSMQGQIDRLKANQIQGTASGTEIAVEDSAEMESNLHISGNSEQDSRSGRNLFNYKTVNNSKAYSTSDEEGWITTACDNSSGTSTLYGQYFTKNLALKTSTQYALFVEIKEISGDLLGEFASVHNSSQSATKIYRSNLSVGTYKYLITTVDSFANANNGLRTVIAFSKGSNSSITYRISVLEDTSISVEDFVYEEYGAMPSPDYPSEIRSVSGDAEVRVEGKNLFDKYGDFSYGKSDALFTSLQADGTILTTANYSETRSAGQLIENIKPNTDYVLSGTLISANGTNTKNAIVEVRKVSSGNLAQLQINSSETKPYSFNLEFNSGDNTSFWISLSGWNTSGTGGKTVTVFDNIQLEEGSTATPYVPYQTKTLSLPLGDIELRSTPDGTRDTFVRVDGVWNKVEKISSRKFVGAENPSGYQIETGDKMRVYYIDNTVADSTKTIIMSNKFKAVTYNKFWGNRSLGYYASASDGTTGGNHRLYFTVDYAKNPLPTSTDWKAWVSQNPFEVIYLRTTPLYTPITDSALIQALDELEQLILNKGYNRITVTSVNGVKAYLDLNYVKDINIVLDNINAKLGGA